MKLIVFALIVLSSFASVCGQIEGNPDNWCRGGFFTRDSQDFKIGTVKGAKTVKSYFFNDDPEDCPAGKNCRGKAYLVGGDKVIVARNYNGFACVWFTPVSGYETVGWVRADTLRLADPVAKPPLSAWHGTWKYADNSISFTDNKLAGFLNVTGDALWKGLGDNVHIGELDGRFAPEGNVLEYSDGDDEYDCKATMRLVGEYLLVADNMKCGGVNVSFSGIYKKATALRRNRNPVVR